MFSRTLRISVVGLLLLVAGCRSPQGGGERVVGAATVKRSLDVLIEPGQADDMEARQYGYRLELRDYMEVELPRRFARYGLEARMIRQRADHAGAAGGPDLLVVRYDSYNPGSSAARMVVGYGAGAASLDISATLFQNEAVALEWKDGCGTSGHWSRLINKLDDNMAKRLQSFYQQQQ